MEIFRTYKDVPIRARGAVVALGNFDGVHLGHQAVISAARNVARRLGVPLAVMVFDPHPRAFFNPDAPPFQLTTLETKCRLLAEMEVDLVFVLPFDRALAGLPAQDFVMKVLVRALSVVHVVVGFDFRFGRGRGGDTTLLSYMGEAEGFGVTVIEAVRSGANTHGGDEYSSTRIRTALQQGDPGEAAALLGRWWTVEGPVLTGDRRGRTIGFPTANLALDGLIEPALGVYAVRVEVMEGPHRGVYGGVANIGRRPTFGHTDVLLEAHLFDFTGDIYGCRLSVGLLAFLRPERKFEGIEALKRQIEQDADRARQVLTDQGIAGPARLHALRA